MLSDYLSYASYWHDTFPERTRSDVARCLRCNAPLAAAGALRGEGLCGACAEGKTIT